MGFDVVIYDKADKIVEIYEIRESLHNEIFNSKKLWRSYLELRKLSEYYGVDEHYKDKSLKDLINDLENYKMFIAENKKEEYQEFIDKISNPAIGRIHIAGD